MSNCLTCQAFELQIKEVDLWITVLTIQRDRAGKLGPTEALDNTLSAQEKLRSELRKAYGEHLLRHKPDAILPPVVNQPRRADKWLLS